MFENEPSRWDQLCAFTEESRLRHDVPGAVLGILHSGEIKIAGFGVTNVDHPLEVTGQTLFQIGSISKTFTGTLIMKMVENGEIDLDATRPVFRRSGNRDRLLCAIGDREPGPAIPVTRGETYDAYPTLTVDGLGRLWLARGRLA